MQCESCKTKIAIRTPQANRYHWACIQRVTDFLNITRDVPLGREQVHLAMKMAFAGATEVKGPKGVVLVPVESKKMSTKQFSELTNQIIAHYSQLGVIFPNPDGPWEEEQC